MAGLSKAVHRGRIELYDTTLRDGTQSEEIAFSVVDKLRIAARLDDIGMDYIEGGFPSSNPRDAEFFKRALADLTFRTAKLCAFGATRRAGVKAEDDAGLNALLATGTRVVTIFGKSWERHAEVLGVSSEENLEIVRSSVAFLATRAEMVVYDAEHFFDGYRANPRYALDCVRAAAEAGAQIVVLCDTNGGGLPEQIAEATRAAVDAAGGRPIGVHCHNDGELAVANSLAGVRGGAVHVQGTINGYGERCGNANLISVAANLQLKLELPCLGEGAMPLLAELSHFVAEVANRTPDSHQAFVGSSAFAHKGGVHVSAVSRAPDSYEHITPESVGNQRRVLVSDLSGRANILYKARQFGLEIDAADERQKRALAAVLERLKELESQGYQFEGAEASFELLVRRELGTAPRYFELHSFRTVTERRRGEDEASSEALVEISVGGVRRQTTYEGRGPVAALDGALRQALEPFYPSLAQVHLSDYKVRVLPSQRPVPQRGVIIHPNDPAPVGTSSVVRVLVESGDGTQSWGTVGVSQSILEASYRAIFDSIEYKLLKDGVAAPESRDGSLTPA